MAYEQEILRILSSVGLRGISVRKLAKHVYNLNCTLFFQPQIEEVHHVVYLYLKRNSKTEQSIVERMERRGYYRLNTQRSTAARQLMLEFREMNKVSEGEEGEEDEDHPQQDLSLSLF